MAKILHATAPWAPLRAHFLSADELRQGMTDSTITIFGHLEDTQSNSNMLDIHVVVAVAAAAAQAAIQAMQGQLQSNMEAMTQSMARYTLDLVF